MDEKKMGEIALKVIKARIRQEGLHLMLEDPKKLRKRAKELGISFKDAKAFGLALVEEFTADYVKAVKAAR